MKKSLMVILFVSIAAIAWASVGVKLNGRSAGQATDIDLRGSTKFVGSTAIISAGTGNGGAASMTSAQDAVDPTYDYITKHISPTVGTIGTLANATAGKQITIRITELDGSGTWVLTPTNRLNWLSATFNAVGDEATFTYINDTWGWQPTDVNTVTINLN